MPVLYISLSGNVLGGEVNCFSFRRKIVKIFSQMLLVLLVSLVFCSDSFGQICDFQSLSEKEKSQYHSFTQGPDAAKYLVIGREVDQVDKSEKLVLMGVLQGVSVYFKFPEDTTGLPLIIGNTINLGGDGIQIDFSSELFRGGNDGLGGSTRSEEDRGTISSGTGYDLSRYVEETSIKERLRLLASMMRYKDGSLMEIYPSGTPKDSVAAALMLSLRNSLERLEELEAENKRLLELLESKLEKDPFKSDSNGALRLIK